MPDLKGGTEGTAGITSGSLHEHLTERSVEGHFAVGNRVGAAATGDAKCIHWVLAVQRSQQMKEGFFTHCLG